MIPAKEKIVIASFMDVKDDKTLHIIDLLAFDPSRSRLGLTLTERGDKGEITRRVHCIVPAADLKLVFHDIVSGQFAAFEHHEGAAGQEYTEARTLFLKRETKYRQPYVLRIDNGQGELWGDNQVKMVKATDSLTIQLGEFEARRLALTCLDYVQQWETINFRKRQDAMSVQIDADGEELEAAF